MGKDWIEKLTERIERDTRAFPRWSLVHSTRPEEYRRESNRLPVEKEIKEQKKAS
jgi:hypothetical protein